MYIGRIVTKSNNVETLDFVDITPNVESITPDIPTLIIGKQVAEKIYGKDNVHVLDKKIKDNVYWTFGRLERRNDFERDLSNFNKMLYKKVLGNIQYEYVNVFNSDYSDIKNLLIRIDKLNGNVFYVTDEHLYAFIDGVVYGISFNDTDYLGIDKEKLINRIKKYNKNNKIITNNYFISKNMRKYMDNSKIMVPYLYFLSKN